MATSPPASPKSPKTGMGMQSPRPMSAMMKAPPRSSSRMSMNGGRSTGNGLGGNGSRTSDEEVGRTAVKVAVRVRPPLTPTDPGYDLIPQRFQRSMVTTTSNTSLTIGTPQGKKLFIFDRVFASDVMQDGVWEYLGESVNAFVQGYNVSLLAYGQSGAGKSFTMGTSGPLEQESPETMGVIPRAATALFEKLEGAQSCNNKNSNRNSMSQLRTPQRYSMQSASGKADRSWQLKATYVEIYNEQLRDLLAPDTMGERGNVTIREDTKGNILLTGLRQVEINSVEDLMSALNFGSSIRQTDATAINAKSSRSHAVFSLNLVQRKSKSVVSAAAEAGPGTPLGNKRMSVPVEAMSGADAGCMVTIDSKLHFVDLAGSERLKNTGAQGDRAREGISINAGLAALGKVISQLSSRQPGAHVSYRDSRLTRLLQDSLGGNAITYMIACVTPAEFHLSETLNTVQYAQRARAIQSKPRIQQVEEGDKQAVIERLKAEVAFLREQIRSSADRGAGDRRAVVANDRSERQSERETELQYQLLDIQENYNTLGQRHARLIAEMAKARDNEATGNPDMDESEDIATERLNRSNSFAEAVEQVVLEYEKTIQSLEQSLSSTRSTLSTTETSLLEKETKCAYIETINTQLQARLQKLMDREANTENYLHDLEAKLDGHTSGEEKNATIILELRKEIARVRENEASCEDYISTLEERLAEADQDTELMQREIDRLEQVVERQRSLGKLDNLLHELDTIQQDDDKKVEDVGSEFVATTNGNSHGLSSTERTINNTHVSRPSGGHGRRSALPEVEESGEEEAVPLFDGSAEPDAGSDQSKLAGHASVEDHPPSPAQSKFVIDKLENVTEELIHLRVEHETTLHDYDELHSKYEDALRTMAELRDAVDEAKHPSRVRDSVLSATSPLETRPSSYLSDTKYSDARYGTQYSSRSLSSELSSAIESPSPAIANTTESPKVEMTDTETPNPSDSKETLTEDTFTRATLEGELMKLKILAQEKEAAERELADKYTQLAEQHQDTLDIVEELKTEVAKAKHLEPVSPRSGTPVIRRKSSQNVMIIDRAHRSFASLRNIASESFENQPEIMQNFELNLNAAMHELHARSERIQELEADIATAKREMESKMTIIMGLTRERSSMQSSPLDISVVSQMKDQLEQTGQQLKEMQEAHATRETELQTEIGLLQAAAKEAVDIQPPAARDAEATALHQERIAQLQKDLDNWESKHQIALDTMTSTEQQMKQTIHDLEAQLLTTNATLTQVREASDSSGDLQKKAEAEREAIATSLRQEIAECKSVIDQNSSRVAELEEAHAAAKAELEQTTQARDAAAAEVGQHGDLVSKLESQIVEHEQSIRVHQENLNQISMDHARDVDEIKASSKQEYDQQLSILMSEHAENIRLLESDLSEAREELMNVAAQVSFVLGTEVGVDKISERMEDLVSAQKTLATEHQKSTELEGHVDELSNINTKIMQELETVKEALGEMLIVEGEKIKNSPSPVSEQISAVRKRMAELETKNKKHSRLVEELEDQLQTNYDQAQITNNRLSTLESERTNQLDDAMTTRIKLQSELEAIREEYTTLQARLEEASDPKRSNSLNSQMRKTGSVGKLPSPPPMVPLPPLPGNGTISPPPGPSQSPPPGGRPQSNDLAMAQIREDQEARIRTIERHLAAEKQLTQTLEQALTDLERQSNKMKTDCEAWRKRASELEHENKELKDRPQQDKGWRDSLHQVEEERKKRQDAERAARHLEERMNAINQKKKKKGSLNCF